MDRELEELIKTINKKRAKFMEEYLEIPNAIEINGEMYTKLLYYYGLTSKDNVSKIYGMDILLSSLVKDSNDIQCYFIKGVDN